MMRSLFSGVSGLKVHQTKMDVIGNNISNVNTVGFKGSSVNFSDILYQTTSSASGPNAATGKAGINAKQIGLGASVASISTAISVSGGTQRTDNALDVMIEGDAFFIVNNGVSNYFTKAGAFTVDANGTLCTASGCKVMGWQVDPNDVNRTVQDTVSELKVMAPDTMYVEPQATLNTYVTGNIDYKDTQLTGSGKTTTMSFYDNLGHSYMAVLEVRQNEEVGNYAYRVKVTDVLDSNGKSVFVNETEENGQITYTPSDVITGFTFGEEEVSVADIDPETGKPTLDSQGVDLYFDPSTGKFRYVGSEENPKSVNFKVTATEETSPFKTIDVDFSSMTMYASSGASTFSCTRGAVADGSGAGKPQGNMTGLSIDQSGRIYGTYDNGDTKLLSQIAVATFANAAGLEMVGNNMFAATMNSGDFDGVGRDISDTGGKMNTGVLEMSNVDLSTEFTQMITTQRGFQANSRIITTSDTLLEELINLKR